MGLAMKGNQSRTTDFAELNQCCRTTYGHFLSTGKWDEAKVSEKQRQEGFRVVSQLAVERGAPVYLSIDNTVVEKKKPSSKAKRPMEGTGWHSSHLEGKQVFGYQIFGAHISTGNTALCYELRRCYPENGSKIDMAVQLLDDLPETGVPIIALRVLGLPLRGCAQWNRLCSSPTLLPQKLIQERAGSASVSLLRSKFF